MYETSGVTSLVHFIFIDYRVFSATFVTRKDDLQSLKHSLNHPTPTDATTFPETYRYPYDLRKSSAQRESVSRNIQINTTSVNHIVRTPNPTNPKILNLLPLTPPQAPLPTHNSNTPPSRLRCPPNVRLIYRASPPFLYRSRELY